MQAAAALTPARRASLQARSASSALSEGAFCSASLQGDSHRVPGCARGTGSWQRATAASRAGHAGGRESASVPNHAVERPAGSPSCNQLQRGRPAQALPPLHPSPQLPSPRHAHLKRATCLQYQSCSLGQVSAATAIICRE